MIPCIGFLLLVVVSVGAEKLRMDPYPGHGWDHLRFADMLPIFDIYNSNDSTAVQKCVARIPLRQSELAISSTIIDLYNSASVGYERDWMINGGPSLINFGIGGSYSNAYQDMKYQQGLENTATLRNELRYVSTEVLLLPECPLHSQLKSAVIQIANYIKTEQSMMATYAAQIFVLHYGTHYTSRVRIGGRIVEDSFIKTKDLYVNDTVRKTMQVAAKVSFLTKFNLGFGYASSNDTTNVRRYEEQVTNRRISARGGDPFLSGMSVSAWQSTIEDSPVILERALENITMAIDPKQITEVEPFYVYRAVESISRAINTYVETNLIYGCMDRTSSAFNWIANINSYTCAQNISSIRFGGFFRTCQMKWINNTAVGAPFNQTCNTYTSMNFHTSTVSCPLGLTPTLLHTSVREQPIYVNETYGCGWLWLGTCDRTKLIGTAIVTLKLYSCTINSTGSAQYNYGGSFTSSKVNLVTNDKSCETGFAPVSLMNDMVVCHSKAIVTPSSSVKFGGLFSCQINNTIQGNDVCPSGFSPYVMGLIEDDCNLYACLQVKGANVPTLPSISLPPYFSVINSGQVFVSSNANMSNASNTNGRSASVIRMNPIFIGSPINLVMKISPSSWLLPILFLLSTTITMLS